MVNYNGRRSLKARVKCLVLDHFWSDWWWTIYLKVETRMCERCGRLERRSCHDRSR